MINFDYENIYSLLIFILPLLGLLASNIYTSLKSKTWYSNLKIMMPDIFSGNYGLYITSFIFLFAGLSLFLLLHTIQEKSYIISQSESVGMPKWKQSYEGIDMDLVMLWLIPVIFFLIYIINPIMYQSQNTLPAAIMYIFVMLFIIVFMIYTVKFSIYICVFLIPLLFWAFYMILFLFTITDPSKIKSTAYINSEIKNIPMEKNKLDNISSPNILQNNNIRNNPVNNSTNNPINRSQNNLPSINNSMSSNNIKTQVPNTASRYEIKTGKHINIIDNSLKK